MSNIWLGSNGKVIKYGSGVRVCTSGLPAIAPKTLRLSFYGPDEQFDPTSLETSTWGYMGTWTHVSGSVWDFTCQNERWYGYGCSASNHSARYLYGVLAMKSKEPVDASINLYEYTNATDGNSIQNRHIDVVGANLTGVRFIPQLFFRLINLRHVALFDTSMIYNAAEMFGSHNSGDANGATVIPNFNFSGITDAAITWPGMKVETSANKTGLRAFATTPNAAAQANAKLTAVPDLTIPLDTSATVRDMFYGCVNVESGALSLYNKFAAANWSGLHGRCFLDCGSNTVTGATELAQIPSEWGGTGA